MSSETRKYELKARARAQRDTRRRIVEATMGLHAEVGPARTTVAEIARRAGVQRLTVYNHFPDDAGLVVACQQHWLEQNPPPDLAAALAVSDTSQALRQGLARLYGWYAATQQMMANVQRDRAVVPALDALLRTTADAQLGRFAAGLAARAGTGQHPAADAEALADVVVRYATWHVLHERGLSDEEAAATMARVILSTAASAAA